MYFLKEVCTFLMFIIIMPFTFKLDLVYTGIFYFSACWNFCAEKIDFFIL